jgi:hypothetical protein
MCISLSPPMRIDAGSISAITSEAARASSFDMI